ncbi:cysteine desulfurase [Rhodobacteraceae bacterium]|nr:cysteine desulfurase [Paracoccaceae bacterium]
MSERVYLDWNATAPLRSEARDAMIAAMDVVGNPSSVHAEGRAAKGLIERARGQVATAVGCKPQDVIFTSGASESASCLANWVGWIISAGVEHDAVLAHQSTKLPLTVDGNGRLVVEGRFDTEILGALSAHELVAVQAANSETGVLQNVAGVSAYMKERFPKLRVLSDAVQAIGKMPVALEWWGIDYALISAHKLGGPKGVGALIAMKGTDGLELTPHIRGGGQEMGRRGGTENVIGIAGFGAAAEAAAKDLADGAWDRVAELRKILENALEAEAPNTILIGKDAPRLPNTSCFATPGWKGETQVMAMDLAGFAISAGSACSSGKVRASRVLQAMGFDDVTAASAIRVSMGPTTTEDEVLRFIDAWTRQEKKFRQRAA